MKTKTFSVYVTALLILQCIMYNAAAETNQTDLQELLVNKGWDKGVAIVTKDGIYGTGWWVSKDVMITAAHVVEYKYKTVDIIHGSYHSTGKVIHIDKRRDIAVIKVNKPMNCAFIFKLAKKIRKTETIYVIGYPYELVQIQSDVKKLSANPRIAKGTISWIDIDHGIAEITAHTDAGNSGGPVVNQDGEVVGLVTFAIIGRAATLYFITISPEVQEVLNKAGVEYKQELGVSYDTKQTIKYSLIGAGFAVFILVLFGRVILRRS